MDSKEKENRTVNTAAVAAFSRAVMDNIEKKERRKRNWIMIPLIGFSILLFLWVLTKLATWTG